MAANCIAHIVENNLLADTHCHLHSSHYGNTKLKTVFKRALAAGVAEIWLMSIDEQSFQRNLEIMELPSELKLRLGLGFDMELLVSGSDLFDSELFKLSVTEIEIWVTQKLLELKNIAGAKGLEIDLVGEIGLDHYWLDKSELDSEEIQHSKELQLAMFKAQLQFAKENNLPVSLHSRGAEALCIDVVKEFQPVTVIFHSFTGTSEQIKLIREMDCYVGVNGIVTYSSARELKLAVTTTIINKDLAGVYASKFLLETDAPYLIPSNAVRTELKVAYGEAINEPAQVGQVLAALI